jgi:hypothetical protein
LSLDQPHACQIYQALEAMSAAAYAAAPADDGGASPGGGVLRTAFEGAGAGDRLPLKGGAQADEASSAAMPAPFDGGIHVVGGFVPPESALHPRTGSSDAARPTMSLAAAGASDPFSRLLPGAQATVAQPAPGDPPGSTSPGGPPPTGSPAGVPEPTTWLLMILGLFGLGAALRRRPRPAF